MNEQDVEQLLKRYEPAGPSPELRARIVRVHRPVRLWPWSVAASVLLVGASALHARTNRMEAGVIVVSPPDPAATAIRDLTELLGGGEMAHRFAQAEIASLLSAAAAPSFPDESETP